MSENWWWCSEEWHGLVTWIRADPDDDTVRLVAADWLDDLDDPRAAVRAELIRYQVRTAREPVWMHSWHSAWKAAPPDHPFLHPELTAYRNTLTGLPGGSCYMLEVERGFPRTAVWHPWQFNKDVTLTVMGCEPVRRVELTNLIAEFDGILWGWTEPGPDLIGESDDGDGQLRACTSYMLGGTNADFYERRAEAVRVQAAGHSLHRECYFQSPGVLPAAVWDRLPREGRTLTIRTGYPSLPAAFRAAFGAALHCAREWAGFILPAKPLPPDTHRLKDVTENMAERVLHRTYGGRFGEHQHPVSTPPAPKTMPARSRRTSK